jgi:hypothetical protein
MDRFSFTAKPELTQYFRERIGQELELKLYNGDDPFGTYTVVPQKWHADIYVNGLLDRSRRCVGQVTYSYQASDHVTMEQVI